MANKQTIIFLLYHGTGHFNGCFKLARTLRETHRVIFAGVEFFRNHVVTQGFEYYPLKTVPFGIGLEQWMNTQEKKKHVYIETVRDRFNSRLYKIREQELKNLVSGFNPDHILLDAQQSTDFIVLYPLIRDTPIQLSLIHTMLPSTLHDGIAPLNSTALPGDTAAIREAHRKVKYNAWKRKWIQGLKFTGMNDHMIIRRMIKKNNIPADLISQRQSLFPFNLKGIREFILAPKEFDLPGIDYGENQHFIGSQVDRNRFEMIDPDYFSQSAMIYERVRSENHRLIYCSLGTIAPENRSVALSLFKKIIEAIKNKKYFLLLSFQLSEEELSQLTDSSENIKCFKNVPQLEVLSKADLFITHGGLNSIKESIDAGVPMLVYPINSNYDMNGNSSRVVYHKLGLRGDVDNETIDEISDKISKLLSLQEYKESITRLKKANELYRPENFLSYFESTNTTSSVSPKNKDH